MTSDRETASSQVRRVESTVVPLPIQDIDTDQIIPARYLKIVDKSGLAEGLFSNWRDQPDFPLARPEYQGAEILLAGDNFGCGSSREHAPWALLAGGFKAVLSTRFADIFRNNALKNGLLVVTLEPAVWQALLEAVENDPAVRVAIDLETSRVELPGGETTSFEIDPFARHCLLEGIDPFGFLLEQVPAVEAWEESRRVPVEIRPAL